MPLSLTKNPNPQQKNHTLLGYKNLLRKWPLIGSFILLLAASYFVIQLSNTVYREPQDIRNLAAENERAGTITSETVKVVVIRYLPENQQKRGFIDPNYVGPEGDTLSIASVRDSSDATTQAAINALEQGSRYHAYTNANAQPYVRYSKIGNTIEHIEPLPLGSTPVPWNPTAFRPDYTAILNRENICELVDSQGVRQVWLWGYHHGRTEPAESNMAMGRTSQANWNHGSFGDVSNSEQTNDLPICNKTYTVFNYNFTRGTGEALEDHTHQLESLYGFLQERDAPELRQDGLLFWNKFVGKADGVDSINNPGCGWTHFPPNITDSTTSYNWYSHTPVASDCMDWKPDGTGTKTAVSCETWGGASCPDDGGTAFKIWWMQSLPGHENGLIYQFHNVRNWWKAVTDFDGLMAAGGGLVEPTAIEPPDLSPEVNVTYPTEGQAVALSVDSLFCLVDTPVKNSSGLQRKHNSNDAGWSTYQPVSKLCFEPKVGSNSLKVQYKNMAGYEGPVMERRFSMQWSCPDTPHVNYDQSDSTITLADYIVFLNMWRSRNPRGNYDCSAQINLQDYIKFLNDWRRN